MEEKKFIIADSVKYKVFERTGDIVDVDGAVKNK